MMNTVEVPRRNRETDYDRVGRAIRFLEARRAAQPSLDELAAVMGLSPHHCHRLFSRWVGTTPKRFLQALTAEHAKQALAESRSVLDAAFAAGLSSPGRLHDLMVNLEAVSPGEYRAGGDGIEIRWGTHATPFGEAFLGITGRGICALEFLAGRQPEEAADELAAAWPAATLLRDRAATGRIVARVFPEPNVRPEGPFHLLVRGTNFQVRVWQALLRVPPGAVISYGDLARRLGKPGAARAVGGAVGSNPISYLIPCHRVVREATGLGEYRWGAVRKHALLAWEAARLPGPAAATG
jgi:AraC family transcriptional regulator of adaptative response/methylated-DNA-[protein]-cysteine methyltransferase